MRRRDKRYDLIKSMFAEGKITSFNDIFEYIPKTIVAGDIGKKVARFNRVMLHINEFTLGDLFLIAKFCNLDEFEMVKLAVTEYKKKKSLSKSSTPDELP